MLVIVMFFICRCCYSSLFFLVCQLSIMISTNFVVSASDDEPGDSSSSPFFIRSASDSIRVSVVWCDLLECTVDGWVDSHGTYDVNYCSIVLYVLYVLYAM